jgi:hypothetical protein
MRKVGRKESYIDFFSVGSHGMQYFEIGRSSRIILEGGRLWRSTVLTMGHQQADKIEVLSDVRGIFAEFKSVRPLLGNGPQTCRSLTALLNLMTKPSFPEPYGLARVVQLCKFALRFTSALPRTKATTRFLRTRT